MVEGGLGEVELEPGELELTEAREGADEGTGDGYARYELSPDGESAQIAVHAWLVSCNNFRKKVHKQAFWIRCGFYDMHQPHVTYVVDVDLQF